MDNITMKLLLNSQKYIKQREYWVDKLLSEVEAIDIPYDYYGVPNNQYEEKTLEFKFSNYELERLIFMSKGSDISLYLILVTSLKILLCKYNNENDIIIGSPMYNKNKINEMTNNLVVLRDELSGNNSFKECLLKIKQTTLEAYENQDYPFNKIIEYLNEESDIERKEMIHVLCGLRNIHDIDSIKNENIDLQLIFNKQKDLLNFSIKYNSNLYKEDTIRSFSNRFFIVIREIISNPQIKISDINILTDDESNLILNNFNNTQKKFPYDKTFNEIFEIQVTKNPHKIAVIYENQTLTYKELDIKSNQIAHALRQNGVRRGSLVAILFERSIDMITSIIGILKAGGAYIPIDVSYPISRIKAILSDSKAKHLITKLKFVEEETEFYYKITSGTEIDYIIYLDKIENLEKSNNSFRTFKIARDLSNGFDVDIINQMCLEYKGEIISKEELQNKVIKLCEFVNSKGIRSKLVGILFENPINKIITILALRKANLPIIILENNMDIKERKEHVIKNNIQVLISDCDFIDEVDQMLWEIKELNSYIVLQEYDVYKSEKQENFKVLWDNVASDTTEEVNDYGWQNSYNGEKFTIKEMEQYINNFNVKLSPYINSNTRVFDIGCGHGLVLFEIAPKVKKYLATDLSKVIIEKNKIRVDKEKLSNVELVSVPAPNIDKIGETNYDVVVCSSVIHYFPNTLYLEKVIESAINVLGDTGIIYLDDLIDIDKKKELVNSVAEFKKNNPSARSKLDWNKDLLVNKEFFVIIQNKYPEVIEVEFSNKLGEIENELTRFRYDVLLKIDKKKSNVKKEKCILKDRYTTTDIIGYENIRCSSINGNKHLNVDNDKVNLINTVSNVCDIKYIDNCSKEKIKFINTPNDLSYIIYTSGSTGTPKGAMVEQAGMINHLYAKITDLKLTEKSIVAQNSSHCFDISVWQFLAALLVEGTIVIFSDETVRDLKIFLQKIQENRVTVLQVVPSYLVVMLEYLDVFDVEFKTLQNIIVTGEEVKSILVQKWFKRYPEIKMINAYGPTEASDDITHFIIDKHFNGALVPIGKPLYNLSIYIIDKDEKLCPIGVKGEICVSGVGVGRGYINDIEKSKKVFKEITIKGNNVRIYKTGDLGMWISDGNIQYFGRMDHQVKIRGFRIELGEIENRLLEVLGIEQVVVLSKGDDHNKQLVAYYIAENKLDYEEVKLYLSKYLPKYMIPSNFLKLKYMPLTSNGKIDRNAISKIEVKNSDEIKFVKASNEIEEILVKIWSDLFKIEKGISITDNFFELGGDSIIAIQISSRLQKLGLKLSMQDFFKYPTIEKLAFCVKNLRNPKNQEEVSGNIKLTPIQKYFFSKYKIYRHHYNHALMLSKSDGIDESILRKAVKKIIQHHDVLRLSFKILEENITQVNHVYDEKFINIRCYDLTNTEQYKEKISNFAKEIQGSINLEEGPLMKLAIFKTKYESYLLIVIHHLIIDGISWRILTEDLAIAYSEIEKGNEVVLQDKTTSYKEWSNELEGYSNSDKALKEIDYWKEFEDLHRNYSDPLYYEGDNKVKDSEIITTSLSIEDTRKLLEESSRAYSTEINDILLSALAMAFREWIGEEKLLIDLEGHGREKINESVDVSRTLGWFTSIYPVAIKCEGLNILGDIIKNTKDMLRRVPNKGIGYGILKYLTSEQNREKLKFDIDPSVSFNFLGQVYSKINMDNFELSNLDVGDTISGESERAYALEISCCILDGVLKININFNHKQFNKNDVENLLYLYRNNLLKVIQHCTNREDTELTLTDFSDLDLSQEDVNEFFSELENTFI